MRTSRQATKTPESGTSGAPIQHKQGTATTGVMAAAEDGLSGGGGALPYAERIQYSFGRHSVAGVMAHTGGAAREANESMGSMGYATGNHVAFRGAPDLHTAAHEAAHVIQQRAGVSLKGGVGESGDRYERHADAVAERVVQGKSAEDLLDQFAGGGVGHAIQQRCARPASVQHRGRAVQFDETPVATQAPAPPFSTQTPSSPSASTATSLRGHDFATHVQMLARDESAGGHETTIQDAAAKGIGGSTGKLPYAEQIQRSFGSYDLSNVQAHTDTTASAATRAMGAHAYATGNHVVLGDSGKDLHTVAHEAAHVVQQRAGVALSGGVGKPGDVYERHADAVADRVVQGKSAEDLLAPFAGGVGGQGHVQQQASLAQPVQGIFGLGGDRSDEVVDGLRSLGQASIGTWVTQLQLYQERLSNFQPATFGGGGRFDTNRFQANRQLVTTQYEAIARESRHVQEIIGRLQAGQRIDNVRQILSQINDVERGLRRASRRGPLDLEADPTTRLNEICEDIEAVQNAISLLGECLSLAGVFPSLGTAFGIMAGALNGVCYAVRGIYSIFDNYFNEIESVYDTRSQVDERGNPIVRR